MIIEKSEKISPSVQSIEIKKITYEVKKESGQPSNSSHREINTELITNMYDGNNYQNSKTDYSQPLTSKSNQGGSMYITSSTYGRRNQGTQEKKITVNKTNYAVVKNKDNANTSIIINRRNQNQSLMENKTTRPNVYTKSQIANKYQISSRQNKPTSNIYNSRKINNSRPNVISSTTSKTYNVSKYDPKRNYTTKNIFNESKVTTVTTKRKVVTNQYTTKSNHPPYKSSSLPREMRNNLSSHSIIDIKNTPKKTYVLNVRKNDIIRFKVGHKRRNNDLGSLKPTSNHSIKITRNVTRERRTVADLPDTKKTNYKYDFSYHPNTSNLANRSIDATSSKKNKKKEITLTPRKLQVIKSTKFLRNKNPFEQNLRNKNNIIEIKNIKHDKEKYRSIYDNRNKSTYEIKINRNINDILNNKSTAVISKYDYKNSEPTKNTMPIIQPYQRKVFDISNNKRNNEPKPTNITTVYEPNNKRKSNAYKPSDKVNDNDVKYNYTVTKKRQSVEYNRPNKDTKENKDKKYKRASVQDDQKVLFKSRKILENLGKEKPLTSTVVKTETKTVTTIINEKDKTDIIDKIDKADKTYKIDKIDNIDKKQVKDENYILNKYKEGKTQVVEKTVENVDNVKDNVKDDVDDVKDDVKDDNVKDNAIDIVKNDNAKEVVEHKEILLGDGKKLITDKTEKKGDNYEYKKEVRKIVQLDTNKEENVDKNDDNIELVEKKEEKEIKIENNVDKEENKPEEIEIKKELDDNDMDKKGVQHEEKTVEIKQVITEVNDNKTDNKLLISKKDDSFQKRPSKRRSYEEKVEKVEKVVEKETHEDNDDNNKDNQVITIEEKKIDNVPAKGRKSYEMKEVTTVEKKILVDSNNNNDNKIDTQIQKVDSIKGDKIAKKEIDEIKELVSQSNINVENLVNQLEKIDKLNDNKNTGVNEVTKKEIKIEVTENVNNGEGSGLGEDQVVTKTENKKEEIRYRLEIEEKGNKIEKKEEIKVIKDNEDVHLEDADKLDTKGYVEYEGENGEMVQQGRILDNDEEGQK